MHLFGALFAPSLQLAALNLRLATMANVIVPSQGVVVKWPTGISMAIDIPGGAFNKLLQLALRTLSGFICVGVF
jgi:hypothetical protein